MVLVEPKPPAPVEAPNPLVAGLAAPNRPVELLVLVLVLAPNPPKEEPVLVLVDPKGEVFVVGCVDPNRPVAAGLAAPKPPVLPNAEVLVCWLLEPNALFVEVPKADEAVLELPKPPNPEDVERPNIVN
ncbi:hypothetical protein WICPIJ_010105 [Wickerhamomyces pijperi]|uniref:Uncharacterized protein n=1 Tax=Wickerhamomyces pijperi TaxID=599730 RepID=A0A9P8TAQ7_WICPI|nr:hypothetical protein WICPIJ_010105 [Wickerhamomyces pijperi]